MGRRCGWARAVREIGFGFEFWAITGAWGIGFGLHFWAWGGAAGTRDLDGAIAAHGKLGLVGNSCFANSCCRANFFVRVVGDIWT